MSKKKEYYKNTISGMVKESDTSNTMDIYYDEQETITSKECSNTLDVNGALIRVKTDPTYVPNALKAIQDLIKALEAGGYSAAPSGYTGGPLVIGDLEKALDDFNKEINDSLYGKGKK